MFIAPTVFEEDSKLTAVFSTREGGVSNQAYASLNLGLSTDDKEERVLENRRRLCKRLGTSSDRLAIAGQVHGSKIKEVSEPGLFPGYDGLVTTRPELYLAISAADCAAVLMADLQTGVIGACHAGWRGAASGVVGNTVNAMKMLGAHPHQMRAYVSPCISVEHFEVGSEVAEQFASEVVVYPPNKEKPHVDLKASIARQLQEVGIAKKHLEVSPYCTYADNDRFFSYRAQDGTTGRMMGIIGQASNE